MAEASSDRLSALALGTRSRSHRGLPVSERRLLLMGLDLLGVGGALVAAYNLHSAGAQTSGFGVPRVGLVTVCGLWLLSAETANAYDLRVAINVRATLRSVGVALGGCFVGMLMMFLVFPYQVTRPTLLLWLPMAAVAVVSGRLVYRRVFGSSYFAGRIALIATREALETSWSEISSHMGGLYHVAGVIDPSRADCADRLRSVVSQRSVGHIVLGVGDDVSRALFESVLECHEAGVAVRSLADLYEEITGRLLLDQLGHTWLSSLPMRNETSRLYSGFKRAVDVGAASLLLIVLGVVLLPVAIAHHIEDGGPLFHRQQRVGKYGHVFSLTKLRTMEPSSQPSLTWAEAGDSRITRTGWLLRKLHLDELPQAWAILRGDMSLIGPRPEQPQYVEELRQQIDFYVTRLTVRPGLTGWAQVNYGYGSGVAGARVKLSYDLYYIKRQSASLDVLILGRTLLAVLSLRGR